MRINKKAAIIVAHVLKEYDGPTRDFTQREERMLDALYDCAEGIVKMQGELDQVRSNLRVLEEGSINE